MSEGMPRPGKSRGQISDEEYLHKVITPQQIEGSDPLVMMAVGRTPTGTGFALMRNTQNKDARTVSVAVFQRRWVEGPASTEESLVIMFQALRWYLEEQGIPLP